MPDVVVGTVLTSMPAFHLDPNMPASVETDSLISVTRRNRVRPGKEARTSGTRLPRLTLAKTPPAAGRLTIFSR